MARATSRARRALDVVAAAAFAASVAAIAIALSSGPPAGGPETPGAESGAARDEARSSVVVEVRAPGASDHTTRASVVLYRGGSEVARADVAATDGAPEGAPAGGVEFSVGPGSYAVALDGVPVNYDGSTYAPPAAFEFSVGADGGAVAHVFDLEPVAASELSDDERAAALERLAAAGIGYVPAGSAARDVRWGGGWSEVSIYGDEYEHTPAQRVYVGEDGYVTGDVASAVERQAQTGMAFESAVVPGYDTYVAPAHEEVTEHAGS